MLPGYTTSIVKEYLHLLQHLLKLNIFLHRGRKDKLGEEVK